MNLSIVTCTLNRPSEILELLENIKNQNLIDFEHIIVDGAEPENRSTELAVNSFLLENLDYPLKYHTSKKGTSIQRNYGIEKSIGNFIAFIDDDMRLNPNYFDIIFDIFGKSDSKVAAITGYREGNHFMLEDQKRWRLIKSLKLLKTFSPGKYDIESGYPINNNMQIPFTGTKEIDFMTTSNAVWKREVMDKGNRFSDFFIGYGVLEDCHFAMKARLNYGYTLLQSGEATCNELHSQSGRENRELVGAKYIINYYFVFNYFYGPLKFIQKWRFFRYQIFEFIRIFANFLLKGFKKKHYTECIGRIKGIFYCLSTDFNKIVQQYK